MTKLPIGQKVTNHQQRAGMLPGYWHEMLLQVDISIGKHITRLRMSREDARRGPKISLDWNSMTAGMGSFLTQWAGLSRGRFSFC